MKFRRVCHKQAPITRPEHWAGFSFLGGFGFGKGAEKYKIQTQNRPKNFWAVSVLVCRFWAGFGRFTKKKRPVIDFELFCQREILHELSY